MTEISDFGPVVCASYTSPAPNATHGIQQLLYEKKRCLKAKTLRIEKLRRTLPYGFAYMAFQNLFAALTILLSLRR